MGSLGLTLYSTESNSRDYCANIKKALVAGSFMRVAHLERIGHYLTVKDNQRFTCILQYAWMTSQNGLSMKKCILTTRIFVHTVTRIRGEWLIDIAPEYYDFTNYPECDAKRVLELLYKKRHKEKVKSKSKH